MKLALLLIATTLSAQTWEVRDALPPGMSIEADGKLTGNPTTAGLYSFKIPSKDAKGERHAWPAYLALALRFARK